MNLSGLKGGHLAVIALSLFQIWAVAAADRPLSANYKVYSQAFNSIKSGYNGANKAKEEFAQRLETQLIPPTNDIRSSVCSEVIGQGETTIAQIAKLKGIKSREEAIAILGEPYCISHNETDIWLAPENKIFEVKDYGRSIARLY